MILGFAEFQSGGTTTLIWLMIYSSRFISVRRIMFFVEGAEESEATPGSEEMTGVLQNT